MPLGRSTPPIRRLRRAIRSAPGPRSPARPLAHRRAAAWVVTGPLGHLYGGVADWVALAARWSWARARGRDPETLI